MNPIVTTRAGDVRGALVDGCFSFLGIPYAAEPTGALRFAGPEPHAAWEGVRDALVYGATAAQPAQDFTLIPEPPMPGDNCLNLNVFTPELGSAGLPVLVWIHGGGFMSGCSASPWYRGEGFARDDIVVVSLNYRLGLEGFAVLKGAPANRGVLDWVAALTWVQDNIAQFGGDPGNVTIAGQSAGAAACMTLMAVPRAQGLFHRVIAMSGSAHLLGTLADAEAATQQVADLVGIKATREDFAATSVERLLEAQGSLSPVLGAAGGPVDLPALASRFASQLLAFAPVPDGDVLPEHPVHALQGGAGSDLPLLIGATAEEFTMLTRMGGPPEPHDTLEALTILGLAGPDASDYVATCGTDAVGQALTDRMFRVPARRSAEIRTDAAPTYLYDFGWRSSALGGVLGAGHCVDVPFAFDALHAEGVELALGPHAPQSLADTVHRAWVGFICSGEPGWPAYGPDRTTMVFGETSAVSEDPLLPWLMKAWAALP